MTLEQSLPTYDRREVHRRTCGDAEAALAAIRDVTPRQIRGFRLLFAARSALARHRSQQSTQSLWDAGLGAGFRLLDESPAGVVVGAIGQFWRLRGGQWAQFEGSSGFAAFVEPGYAKAAIGFWVDGRDLVTETRVLGTDPLSARRMARYWVLIRPGSGLIRRGWLRAADRLSAA